MYRPTMDIPEIPLIFITENNRFERNIEGQSTEMATRALMRMRLFEK